MKRKERVAFGAAGLVIALAACLMGRTVWAIGRPGAYHAVGGAVGANPLSICVPCHRVIGTNGSLTGYAWGLPMKEALLELERR